MSSKLGTLTLDMVAKVGQFVEPIANAEKKSGESFNKMRKHVNDYSKVAVAGALAAGTGVLAMARDYTNAASEIRTFASISNTTTQEFQKMAVGAETVGISTEKLADQLKDFNEKLGEFITIGSGGAKDFFEQIATQTEGGAEGARKLALEMQNLSGPKALQLYVDKLEEAGVTQQQMSFYLESMASDTTNLIPLLKNGGEGFKFWADAAERAGVIMDESAIQKAAELKVQLGLLDLQVKGIKNQFMQGLLPALISVGDAMSEGAKETGMMTQAGEDFGNVFKGVAVVAMGVYSVIKMLSNAIAGLAVDAISAKKQVDIAAEGKGVLANLPGIKLLKTAITASVMSKAGNSGVNMALTDNAKLADSYSKTIEKVWSDSTSVAVKQMAALQQSQAGVTKGSEEWVKKQNELAEATDKANKKLEVNARVKQNAAKFNFAGIESAYALPEGILSAINMQESKGNGSAIGPMTKYGTAKGGFQFLDGTAKRFGLVGNAVFDTGKSAEATAKYLQILYQKFGIWEKAISAYHAGEGNVSKGTGIGPINREYVKNILEYMDSALKGAGTTASDAIQYVEETHKEQMQIAYKYLTEQEKMEIDHRNALLDINLAYAGNTEAIDRYTVLQNAMYQKDLDAYKKVQQEKKDAEFGALNGSIAEMQSIGMNATAMATLSPIEYQKWELNSQQQAGYSQLGDAFANTQKAINDSEYLSDTEKYAQLEALYDTYLQNKASLSMQYAKEEEDLRKQQQQQQLDLWGSVLSQGQNTFAQLTQSVKDSAGEQSGTYKAMFAMQKAFTIASSTLAAYNAYTTAFADPSAMTLAQKFAGGAAVMAALMPAITTMTSLSLDGMAHDGIDNVPSEGTWLLDKGERVVDARTNSDLKNYLSNQKQSGANITINNSTNAGVSARQNPDGSVTIDVVEKWFKDSMQNPNSTVRKGLAQNTTATARR